MSDAVSMVPRGWDIGPTIPMGPSPRPSWTARSNGQFHEGQPLYIHTYIHVLSVKASKVFRVKFLYCHKVRFVVDFFL